jgi:hypothetical protein
MTTPVDELAARRKPAWSSKLQHHSWFDIPPEQACPRCGHEDIEHCCTFCGFQYHSAQEAGVWVKHWTLGEKRGRVREMPKCPGPKAIEPDPAPLTVAASPVEAASTPPCCRCRTPGVPPCGPTRRHLGGFLCQFQADLLSARTANGGVA